MAVFKSKKSKKMELKNYVILVVLFLLGGLLTLYLCKCYSVYSEYKKEVPVIRDSLLEIRYDDLEHYVMENPSSVIYMCTAKNEVCRSYEKDFKKLIEKNELKDAIVYLNLSELDQDEFVNNFNSKYELKNKLTTDYPAIVVFDEGRAISVLQGSKSRKLTVSSTRQFLELNNIREGE